MDRSWNSASDALRFALGVRPCDVPKSVVLLHKDRLDEVERLMDSPRRVAARWKCLFDGDHDVAYVATPAGASDVADCVLHLAAAGVRRVLYTGTCGALTDEIAIGSVSLVTSGWAADSILDWIADPMLAMDRARLVEACGSRVADRVALALMSTLYLPTHNRRIFSTAVQSLESPHCLRRMHELGAEVVDMETAQFFAVANGSQVEAAALVWCTDVPSSRSFYDVSADSVGRVREQRWMSWPAVLLASGRAMTQPDTTDRTPSTSCADIQ